MGKGWKIHNFHSIRYGLFSMSRIGTIPTGGFRVSRRGRGGLYEWLHLGATGWRGVVRKGERDAYWGEGFVATPVYDGTALAPGVSIDGPALIEEAFTVVVLPPGARAELDALGNYVIEV